jgi:hypothetical protein
VCNYTARRDIGVLVVVGENTCGRIAVEEKLDRPVDVEEKPDRIVDVVEKAGTTVAVERIGGGSGGRNQN